MIGDMKLGRPANLEAVKRVRYLRNVHRLSFRKIKQKMEEEDSKKYHVSQIHTWFHYAPAN